MKITSVTGDTLIQWGFKPGKWFKEAIAAADLMARSNHFGKTNYSADDMIAVVRQYEPAPIVTVPRQDPAKVPVFYNIDAENDHEQANVDKVVENLKSIAEVPVVRAIAVMPDACPVRDTIPVGSVVVAENAIVPNWHSADICCSVAISVFPSDTNPTAILDAGMQISHFGKGGRPYCHDINVSQDLLNDFESNRFLRGKSSMATKFFGTQGDGNHFFYVGRLDSTGQIALVTHHGSRKPGATLYSEGMEAAQRLTSQICPEIHKNNLWIPFDTEEGQEYWEALQLIRRWTKGNHFSIHNAVAKAIGAKVKDRYWNEHNFVFRREFNGKNYFVHAKGATPNYAYFGSDATSHKTLIPLNMSEPILVTRVNDNPHHGIGNHHSLGFSPHGAGRNFSRTEFGNQIVGRAKEMIADVTSRYDVRAFSGKHDISEFPDAYKNANSIISQIKKYDLTNIVDMVQPIGCIMAGHDGTDWRAIKKAKKEAKNEQTSE